MRIQAGQRTRDKAVSIKIERLPVIVAISVGIITVAGVLLFVYAPALYHLPREVVFPFGSGLLAIAVTVFLLWPGWRSLAFWTAIAGIFAVSTASWFFGLAEANKGAYAMVLGYAALIWVVARVFGWKNRQY